MKPAIQLTYAASIFPIREVYGLREIEFCRYETNPFCKFSKIINGSLKLPLYFLGNDSI